MKIKHAVAVAFLENFGFTKAPDWDNEKLVSKLNQVPEKVDGADVPDEFKAVYQELGEAQGQVEISGGVEPKAEVEEAAEDEGKHGATKSKGKKTGAKKETAPAKEKSEKKTKAKGGSAKKQGNRTLGDIFGFSIGSVINRLGKEGLKAAVVREILESKKLKVKSQTVAWNVNEGKGGRGKAADLSKEQIKSLKSAISSKD